jgi:hypothetical protein
VTRTEFRMALEHALEEIDADERLGAVLRAAGLDIRFEFTDLEMRLDLEAASDPARHLIWSFDGPADHEAKLRLTMDSEVANAYLQGEESLAIAMARRQVECEGDSRVALLYLPAIRLLREPYRRVVRREFPRLAVG